MGEESKEGEEKVDLGEIGEINKAQAQKVFHTN
jgi:hypothetical protein